MSLPELTAIPKLFVLTKRSNAVKKYKNVN